MPMSSSSAPLRPRGFGSVLAATLRTTIALMLREMSTRFGRTPGGYLWALLEPTAVVLVLAIGFSLMLRNPSLGTSFLLFYATGYLPLKLFMQVSNMVARAISFSRPLLQYPTVTWVDAVLARFLLNVLTELLVAVIVLGGIFLVIDTHAVIRIGPIFASIGLIVVLALGVGVLNVVPFGLFPAWERLWSIATRPLVLASGLFYIYEDLPQTAQEILWFNPLMHLTGLLRSGFYPMYEAAYASPVYVLLFGLVPLFFGVLMLSRFHLDLLQD
jgi:capsular polysaccharide transport system permease protein